VSSEYFIYSFVVSLYPINNVHLYLPCLLSNLLYVADVNSLWKFKHFSIETPTSFTKQNQTIPTFSLV